MRLILINILILLSFCAFAQNEQVLRNGYVAATNNGIYFLWDGDEEWIHFNINPSDHFNINPNGGLTRDLDSITTISFNGQNLVFSGSSYYSAYSYYSASLNSVQGVIYGDQLYDFFGHEIYEITNGAVFRQNFITNKFKTTKVTFLQNPTYIGNYIGLLNSNTPPTTWEDRLWNNITGIETDNDSTIVCVGTNNKLYKLICYNSLREINRAPTLNLTSNSTSNHKICFSSDDGLFWIVSDELRLYRYNKTSYTYVGNATSFGDKIYSIVSGTSIYSNNLYMLYRNLSNEVTIGVVNKLSGSMSTSVTTLLTNYDYADIIYDNTLGKIIIGFGNNFRIYEENLILDKTVNLPSGIIIYDIEKIEYLK